MQDNQELLRQAASERVKVIPSVTRVQGEVVRKSLHLLVSLVPLFASVDLGATLALLTAGILFYAFAETSRLRGNPILIVSDITLIASRERDMGGFVLGPVTLGLGAMLSLILYPLPAANIAIFALAFGDGFASLVGTTVRGPRIPLLRSKTLSGSLACFAAVFIVTLRITQNPISALTLAGVATFLEAAPVGDFDNILIPFGVGMIAVKLLPLS
jgi:dolichol kinase